MLEGRSDGAFSGRLLPRHPGFSLIYRTIVLVALLLSATVVVGAPVGKLHTLSAESACSGANDLEAHWTGVAKNGAGRVTKEAFDKYFMSTAFGQAVPDDLKAQYKAYLNDIFSTGWAMMPHRGAGETPTLGSHCFRSVATLPFEFYKDGSSGGYCKLFSAP